MNDNFFEELEDNGAEIEDSLERLSGDKKLYFKYLKEFLTPGSMTELAKAASAKEYEIAFREVHTLKGVSLNLGLLPIADICMDMLIAFRNGENDVAIEKLPELNEVFNKWIMLINTLK